MKKSRLLFLLLITLHAFWMMLLTYFWVNMPYSYELEGKISTTTSILKNVVFGLQEKPSRNSLLFINLSYDKMLVPRYDQDGFPSGKIAITDRESLNKFLEISAKNPNYKFIILDFFSEDSTQYDSVLQSQINRHPNLIMPYHFEGDVRLESNLHGWTGLADYTSDFGNFLKYQYVQRDTCKTIPLKLYKRFNNGDITRKGPFYFSEGKLALDAVLLDFPVRMYNIFTYDTTGYNSVHLCELVNLPEAFVHEMTKDKMIVIGDLLDRDMHSTMYGTMAGPLMHINGYLELVRGDHLLSPALLVFVFLNYFVLSLVLFYEKGIHSKLLDKIRASKLGFVFDFLKYVTFLFIVNVLSYLIFGVHLNVLFLGLYVVGVEYIINWVRALIKKKEIIKDEKDTNPGITALDT